MIIVLFNIRRWGGGVVGNDGGALITFFLLYLLQGVGDRWNLRVRLTMCVLCG